MTRTALTLLLAASLVTAILGACSSAEDRSTPFCTNPDDSIFVLLSQSVPSATQLPCVSELPAGWSYAGSEISSDLSRFWLDSDRAGIHAVEIALRSSCDTEGAIEQRPAPDEAGTTVYVRPDTLRPAFTGERFLLFPGGCIGFSFRFSAGASSTLAIEAIEAVSLLPRAAVVEEVRKDPGLILCGAGAPPCAG